MISIADTFKLERPKLSRSPRTQVVKEIYQLYDTISEKKLRRSANIERYRLWLRQFHMKHSKESYVSFSKTKMFIKPITPASMAFFLSHIKSQDLYYILSVAKDKSNRNESIGAYIQGLSKIKK